MPKGNGNGNIIKTSAAPKIVKEAAFQNSGGPVKSFGPGHQFAEPMGSVKSKKKVKR